MDAMGRGAAAVLGRLSSQGRLDGVLAVGGSGGSSVAAAAMQALPVGVPKLLVSTVASGDGTFRQNLEETGMGFDLEIDMIRQAHNLELLTAAYVFDAEQAAAMTAAGADILVPHVGLTTSGTIGAAAFEDITVTSEGDPS